MKPQSKIPYVLKQDDQFEYGIIELVNGEAKPSKLGAALTLEAARAALTKQGCDVSAPPQQVGTFEIPPPTASDIKWARKHFRKMREGQKWIVPRTGMVFIKRDGRLELIDFVVPDPVVLPEEMWMTARQLDFAEMSSYFTAAGITVLDCIEGGRVH
jgi:hypothetical protein